MKRIIEIDATHWKCPYCGSDHNEAFPFEPSIPGQTVECTACGKELAVTDPITAADRVADVLRLTRGALCYDREEGLSDEAFLEMSDKVDKALTAYEAEKACPICGSKRTIDNGDACGQCGNDFTELKTQSEKDQHDKTVGCYDCGLEYGGDSWIETSIPNDVWFRISPTGGHSGILCISCIARRCRELGIEAHVTLCGTEPLYTECDLNNCPQKFPERIAKIRSKSIEALNDPSRVSVDGKRLDEVISDHFKRMKGVEGFPVCDKSKYVKNVLAYLRGKM